MDLIEAPFHNLEHHSGFNVGSMSFDVATLADSIKKYIPEFTIEYEPDFRQAIADSWPQSVDDTSAQNEWNWKPEYDLDAMTRDMLTALSRRLQTQPAV